MFVVTVMAYLFRVFVCCLFLVSLITSPNHSTRIIVLYVVMRGRLVPRSSHARLSAGLLVADRDSSTRANR